MPAATLLITAALALAVAGAAKAAVDILTHQEGNNIFESWGPFFDARASWKRKYKNYDANDLRPAFPGATGWLVLFTDFWHLADSVYLLTYCAGSFLLGLYASQAALGWLKALALLAAGRLVFALTFELLYRKVFRKQQVQNSK